MSLAVSPAAAQYAGIPGDPPPVPDAYILDVEVTQPYESTLSIPGITDEDAEHMENP